MSTEAAKPTPEYREVTVPIPTENIKEFFTNKNIFFLANHTQSRLKGATFLTYLSNLAVPSDVRFDEPLSFEEYTQVMDAYMKQRMVSHTPRLHSMMATLLLWVKGVDYKDIPYQGKVPEKYLSDFAKANITKVAQWIHFVDSSMVFVMSAVEQLNEVYAPKTNYENIVDKEYVGHNVVNLYSVPHFTELYFGLPNAGYRMSYFVHQYEDYMFSNQRMAHYFDNENNFIQMVCLALAGDSIKIEEALKLTPEGTKGGTEN